MSKYIDAEQLKAEIDKRYSEYRAKMKTDDFTYYEGVADALDLFEQYIDSLPEQEHPIYQLNQILLDWVREAKTDKEQEARFEAYKRFFELYDEHMMQEPEQPVEGLEEAAENYIAPIENDEGLDYINFNGRDIKDAFIAGAEWQKAKMNWHSVEEFLPEMDEEVIVLKDKQNTGLVYEIAFGHLVDIERCIDYNGWNVPDVKFWMPMPKIPEE